MHTTARVKRVVVALLVVAVVALVAAPGGVAPEEATSASTRVTSPHRAKPRAGTVATVRFTGPGLRAALSPVIRTRPGDPFDAATLEADRARIVEALHDRGHLDATAAAPAVTWRDDGAHVELAVAPGPLYYVRSVELRGAQLRRHPGLAAIPVLATGVPAVEAHLDDGAALIHTWLARRGARARVTIAWALDDLAKQIDVTYVVE